ncbi:VOC family protein [bacterium]|nr:VOC family protein [bacterium]
MKLDQFTIAVTNMTTMVAFYNDVFEAGLTAIPNSPFYVGQLTGFDLVFCPNNIAEVQAEKNRIQMRFNVEDVEVVVNRAKANGGGTYGDRHDTEAEIGWGIHDPDGNSIELRQAK